MLKGKQEDIKFEDIERIFETYGISLSWFGTSVGPVIVKYEFKPESNKDILRYRVKKDDIRYAMKSLTNYPNIYISKSGLYGDIVIVEVPRKKPDYVYLKYCLIGIGGDYFEIPICLGKGIDNKIIIRDFKDIGNLLMSGMTHSGKSVFINSFISTILLSKTPDEVKFLLIDTKQVELSHYNGISHLLYPVCEDLEKGLQLIEWCIEEIERRKRESKKKPYIVLVIDEFADLMLGDESTNSKLEKIAKNGSNVGIHMILSSSKPTVNVFTPELKNAIPSRLVGAMVTGSDSKELIEEESGIDLLGNGDMIFKDVKSGERIRVQAPYISTKEQELVIRNIYKVSEYKYKQLKGIGEEEIDPLFEDGRKIAMKEGKISTSFLQRKLGIGYNRTVRLMIDLERYGVIAPQRGINREEGLVIDYEELLKRWNIKASTLDNPEEKDPLFEDAKEIVMEEGFSSVPLLHKKLNIEWDRAVRLFYQLQKFWIIDEINRNLFEQAKKVVIKEQKASTTLLQKRLEIDYIRATKLIDQLKDVGVIGSQIDAKPREILIDKNELKIERKEKEDKQKPAGDI